jgi:hypothetical protein
MGLIWTCPCQVAVQLEQALEHSTLGDEDLLKYLEGIQTETIIALRDLLPTTTGHSPRQDPPGPGHGPSPGDNETKV